MENLKERLIQIVGVENFSDDPKILDSYAKDKSLVKPMSPWFVVKPNNAQQVQELVKWANQTKIPLIPVSSGAPHFKGDTVPSVPQAVIVDLSGMNRILNINRQQRMAVVEPGVTYKELQDALAKEGLTLSIPLAPRATKSVVASVLEIEPRLNSLHQWNYTDPLRCTEVVWGDGNRMFTGEAGGGALDLQKQWSTERWQVSGTGPMMLDFYRLLTGAQGTMGIVTWASLKCEVDTKVHKFFLVPAKKAKDLNDFVYRVVRLRFSNELMVMNGSYLASLLGESPEHVKELLGELPPWVAVVGIAGRELLPEERVQAQQQDIAEIAQQYGLKMVPAVPGAKGEKVMEKVMNPSGEQYWKEIYKGAFQDIFFVTTLDKTSDFINKMYSLANEAGFPSQDIGIYLQPQNMGTSYHCEFSLPYDSESKKEVDRIEKLFIKASEVFAGMGAFYSRPYGVWSELQLNKDAQTAKILKEMKDIFDPNNILNPGKLSI